MTEASFARTLEETLDDPVEALAQTARGRRTVRALLDAARATFGELGYVATRVEDIVTAAGVSHGTFYTYFDNKAKVFEALVTEVAAKFEAIAAAPWPDDDVTSALEAVIGQFLTVYDAEAAIFSAWLEASAEVQEFSQLLTDARARYTVRVAEQLAPLAESGGHDPEVAAAALVSMVEGYATGRWAAATERERASAVRTLAALWTGGLFALATDGDVPRGGS